MNAEERAAEFPRTFKIPTRGLRNAVQPGMLAKLVFEIDEPGPDGCNGERMWVEVVGKSPDGRHYVGELKNQPTVIPIEYGEHINFGPEHIASL